MTKEEYERLLKSDYWKGYSYSLIKERNFTCHDCGRRFPGERNKLQVHHLHYREANPWSYDPSEVVVLCEECHKKRHGIRTPAPQVTEYRQRVETGNYNRGFESSYSTSERDVKTEHVTPVGRLYEAIGEDQSKRKTLIVGLLLMVFASSGLFMGLHKPKGKIVAPVPVEAAVENEIPAAPAKTKPSASKKAAAPVVREPMEKLERLEELVPAELQSSEAKLQIGEPAKPESRAEKAPEQAREKTTLELLEERNHADVVKMAKREGVSPEGTTTEILERINHADVVKSAKRAGVSTEGTTSEILERITRKQLENW